MSASGELKSDTPDYSSHFYLNIVLLNKDDAVKAQVAYETCDFLC